MVARPFLSDKAINRNLRILGEVGIFNNDLMQLVSKIIGTGRAPMAVIHPKERTPRPELVVFKLRLDYVQNYRYSVFIVIPNWFSADFFL